jgi:hypothetical protein
MVRNSSFHQKYFDEAPNQPFRDSGFVKDMNYAYAKLDMHLGAFSHLKLPDYVGLDSDTIYEKIVKDIDFFIVYGSNPGSTPAVLDYKKTLPTWEAKFDTRGAGDGTVNEFSQNRTNFSTYKSYNSKPSATHTVLVRGFCNTSKDHMDLLNHTGVQSAILSFLSDSDYTYTQSGTQHCNNGKTVLLPAPSQKSPTTASEHTTWPKLEWGVLSKHFGAYELHVSAYNDFSDCVVCTGTSQTSYTANRSTPGEFFWRVRAWGGKWSTARTFTVKAPNVLRSLFYANGEIPRTDDGSSEEGPELGFTVNYYGITHSNIYVNNNGTLSFNEPAYQFRTDLLRSNSCVCIAGYFADVDTRNSLSKTVKYGQSYVNGKKAFIANFIDVGYNYRNASKLNRFQIVLINRSDVRTGDFDIDFNYQSIQWESGDTNGGSAGLGGDSARVGWASGLGDTSFVEFPGSGISGSFLDSNTLTGLRNVSRGSGGVKGRTVIAVRNGIPRVLSGP